MGLVKVDHDALVIAFNDNSLERSYYVDRETGRVFNLMEDRDDVGTEEITWEIEADGGRRFVQVPKLSMEEEMQEQDAFVESLEDCELKKQLAQILESDSDGSGFEDFVGRSREARERWRSFGKARAKERAQKWLEALGMSAT